MSKKKTEMEIGEFVEQENQNPSQIEILKKRKKEIIIVYKASMKFLADETTRKKVREEAVRELADVLLQIAESGEDLS